MTVNETLRRIHRWPRHKRIALLRMALALQKPRTIRYAEIFDALRWEVNGQLRKEYREDHAA